MSGNYEWAVEFARVAGSGGVFVLGVCFVLACTFHRLGRGGCRRVTNRSFSGVRRLFTRVLVGNVSYRLGRNVLGRCVVHGSSLPALHKGLSLGIAVRGGLYEGRRVNYRCSRLSRGGVFGRVVGTAIFKLLGRKTVGGNRGAGLGGLVLFFSNVSVVRLDAMG